ncbi:Protein CBG27101 [Caenorhabditis briggsae]|uniref:Protein CBG27101 n=1 Tax=Caenorhabditis briggsae TaxID=6238 RepID=B6IHH6_CAEBR|nr:Protein CBG27101 [Caenorhabditis briggsae]CAR99356.1 Protein CBG27101 [Caenorhabditis briggsae]
MKLCKSTNEEMGKNINKKSRYEK